MALFDFTARPTLDPHDGSVGHTQRSLSHTDVSLDTDEDDFLWLGPLEPLYGFWNSHSKKKFVKAWGVFRESRGDTGYGVAKLCLVLRRSDGWQRQ